jgi:hypothetical protein
MGCPSTRKKIYNTLEMLVNAPKSANDNGALELASTQHCTWIAELLRNCWTANVASEIISFDEETQRDGILLFYVFLQENVGFTNEAIIVAE